jgi:L-asparaginase
MERTTMKKIVVLTTGGTIASKPSAATGLYTSGAMTAEELIDTKKLGLDVAVEMETVFQIPSVRGSSSGCATTTCSAWS